MHILPSLTSTRQRLGSFLLALASALLVLALGSALVAPAGAQDGCGTYSYGFPGTRLLNDGISNSAGPYAIDLPAGTYTVTLLSHDHHSRQVDIPAQRGEQYHAVLNSGYVSPASTDVPEDADYMTSVFPGQVIGASTGISVIHAGAPGINSVDVLCVGFTPEPAAAVEDATTDRDLTPTDEDSDAQGPTDETNPGDETDAGDKAVNPGDETDAGDKAVNPDAGDKSVNPDAETDAGDKAVNPDDEPDASIEVLPGVEFPDEDDSSVAGPEQDLNDSADADRTPLPDAEVKAKVEFPVAPQLAVTGLGSQSMILLLAGLSLIMVGTVLVRSEKQLA